MAVIPGHGLFALAALCSVGTIHPLDFWESTISEQGL